MRGLRLKVRNIYDIRYEKNLTYILPEKAYSVLETLSSAVYAETAVIIYLYYIDTLSIYYKYIDSIPLDIDIYIISSLENVLEEVRGHICMVERKNVTYIMKENQGRDVSALLVTSRDIVKNYQYVCFLHDKKEHHEKTKEDTLLWIENLWGNQIGSPDYINGILKLFEDNKNLGLIVPPEPIGEYFDAWYGCGWCKSFEVTKAIANNLQLNADIRLDKPPITFGTVLWFRSKAMQKLFDAEWSYSDFNDEGLNNDNYLSYGLERIYAYVAQDAGYDTGTSMTVSYAEKQTGYLQYTTNMIMHEAAPFFPISSIKDLNHYKRNRRRIVEFGRNNEKIYLYGAGKMGRFCAALLKLENITPMGYIVSKDNGISLMEGIPVISVEKFDWQQNIAVIVTVYDEKDQEEIANSLKGKACCNYIKFWG